MSAHQQGPSPKLVGVAAGAVIVALALFVASFMPNGLSEGVAMVYLVFWGFVALGVYRKAYEWQASRHDDSENSPDSDR